MQEKNGRVLPVRSTRARRYKAEWLRTGYCSGGRKAEKRKRLKARKTGVIMSIGFQKLYSKKESV